MNHLRILILAIACGATLTLAAQQTAQLSRAVDNVPEQRGPVLEVGPAYASFQDLRFTSLQFAGAGATLGIGLRRSSEQVQRFGGLRLAAVPMTGADGAATLLRVRAEANYGLERVLLSQFSGGNLLIGGDVRITGDYLSSGAKGNNGTNLVTFASLSPRVSYVRKLGRGRFVGSLAVGLLHFGKDNTSWAFSAPQDYLEDGEFDYQPDGATLAPGTGSSLSVLGQTNSLRTSLAYELGQRWGFRYDWDFLGYRVVEGYATRSALHRLTVAFTL